MTILKFQKKKKIIQYHVDFFLLKSDNIMQTMLGNEYNYEFR